MGMATCVCLEDGLSIIVDELGISIFHCAELSVWSWGCQLQCIEPMDERWDGLCCIGPLILCVFLEECDWGGVAAAAGHVCACVSACSLQV